MQPRAGTDRTRSAQGRFNRRSLGRKSAAGMPPAALFYCSRLLLSDQPKHLLERIVGERSQFVIRAILDRMLNEHLMRMKTNCLAARECGFFKYRRSDESAGNAACIEFFDVLQTARRTRTSISQAFNNDIALRGDLLQ